jgi:glycosyltransferase involved in cell wall biosynthesis
VLVGAEGWLVDELVARIKNHAELGKRLFWLGHISDELLARFYRRASAVILPSEAEGFGLPLVEAACQGVPIIARDIPIFREVGGNDVFYFESKNGGELAAALGDWLAKLEKRQIPQSENIKVSSWRESATQLLDATRGKRPYH